MALQPANGSNLGSTAFPGSTDSEISGSRSGRLWSRSIQIVSMESKTVISDFTDLYVRKIELYIPFFLAAPMNRLLLLQEKWGYPEAIT